MANKMLVGSADWNLWPIGTDYETTFPLFYKHGISNVEIGIYEPSTELTPEKCEEILSVASRHGIRITAALFSITPDRWLSGAISSRATTFIDEFRVFISAMERMGIKYANLWTGADLPDSKVDVVQENLRAMDDIAADFKGIVSIEYKADTVFPDGRHLAASLAHCKNLKILIDTGHAFALEENVTELIHELHNKNLIGAFHLGDALAGDSDADLPCGRIHDFGPIFQALTKIEYSGPANFDLYGAAIDENGPGPESILIESKNYIDDVIKGG